MKRNIIFCLLSPLVFFFLITCKTSHPVQSVSKEAWDQANDPQNFEAQPLNWEEIKSDEFLQGTLPDKPWSDTYWPLGEAGAAARWINPDKDPPFKIAPDINLPDQEYQTAALKEIEMALKDSMKRTKEGKWQDSVYLSPAEKYDLAVGNNLAPKTDAEIDQLSIQDLARSWPLTTNELSTYASNRQNYEREKIDWGWMGHCHGWAPASFLYEKPKHAVLATNKQTGQEILFTEGDVRGMLTKTAADNSFNVQEGFLGTRCNDEDGEISKDRFGRIVDGMFGFWDSGKDDFKASKPIRIYLNNWYIEGPTEISRQDDVQLVFSFAPPYYALKDTKFWLRGVRYYPNSTKARREKIIDGEVYSTKTGSDGQVSPDMLIGSSMFPQNIGCLVDDKFQCVSPPTEQTKEAAAQLFEKLWWDLPYNIDKPRNTDPVAFKYFKTCRDINAGTFHTVLGRYVSKAAVEKTPEKSQGFVMDITRTGQVWNHPIYGYKSLVGEPTPIRATPESVDMDPFKKYRAPNTKYLVDVYTIIDYAVESYPQVTFYQPDGEPTQNSSIIRQKIFHYTLELDDNKTIVGGEWHGIFADASGQPKVYSGEELFKQLKMLATNRTYHVHPKTGERVYHRASDAPDFVWMYKKGAKLASGDIIKADVVEKIYACSMADPEPETISLPDNPGLVLKYKKCEL